MSTRKASGYLFFAVFCPLPPTHDFLYVYFSAVQNVGKSENFAASFLLNSSITCVYTFIVISAVAPPDTAQKNFFDFCHVIVYRWRKEVYN